MSEWAYCGQIACKEQSSLAYDFFNGSLERAV